MPGAVDLRKLEIEGKTLEQIFRDAKGNIDNYNAALDILIDKTSDLLNLDDERVTKLGDYLETLEDVNDSWDKINDFANNNLKFSREALYQVDEIRKTLSDIVSDVSTVRTRTNEQIRNVRTLRDLSGEVQRIFTTQGALEEKSMASLSRRVGKTVELYEYDIRRVAGLSKEISLSDVTLETRERILSAQRRENQIIRSLRRQSVDATGKEKAELEALINYHSILLEKLDLENLKKVEGLKSTTESIKDIGKQVRAETAAIGSVAGLLEKTGIRGLKQRYENYVQSQTGLTVEREAAKKDLAEKQAIQISSNKEHLEDVRTRRAAVNAATSRVNVLQDAFNRTYSRDRLQDAEKLVNTGRRQNGQFVSKEEQDRALGYLDAAYNLENKIKKAKQEQVLAENNLNVAINSRQAAAINGIEAVKNAQEELNRAVQAEAEGRKGTLEVLTGVTPAMLAILPGAGLLTKAVGKIGGAASKAGAKIGGMIPPGVVSAFGTLGTKLAGFFGPIGVVAGTLVKNLTGGLGPTALMVSLAKKLWDAFRAVNVDAAELKRHVGSWEIGTAAVNSQLATSVDWLKTATELAGFTGLNSVTLFDSKQIASAAEFKNLTGASAAEANNLLIRSRLVGQTTDKYRDSLTKGANEGNRLNRSVVTLREVQQGVLKASDATTLSFGNNAEALGRAVVAAKNLGMELSGIEKISDNLLNFESSIASEMEAQLLTGMQLNLSKAREYALENDLEGVAAEIQRQGITAAKFTQMNRIQQEGMAKALGMSREELAKSLILRQLNNGASAEALAAATGMTKEQIEAMNIQQRWQIATQKLAQSFAPIAEVVIDLLDPIAKIVSWIANAVGWLSKGLGHALRLFGLVDKIATPFGFSERFDKGGKQKPQPGSLESAKKSAYFNGDYDKVAELDKQIKTSEASMVSFGKSGKSAFSEVLGGMGSVLSVSLLLGMTFPKLATASKTLFTGLIGRRPINTAVTADKVVDSVDKVNKTVRNVNPGRGLRVLGQNLASFFKAFANPKVLLGIAGISLAAAAVGGALRLAAPAIEAFGNIILNVFQGVGTVIKAVSEAFVTGFNGIADALKVMQIGDIGKLALLGPSFIGLAAGLTLAVPGLVAFGLTGLPVLKALSTIIPKLNTSNISVESKQISQESGKVSEKATKKVETKKEIVKTEEKPVDLTILQNQLSQVIGLLKEGQTIDLDTGKILTSISRTVTSYS